MAAVREHVMDQLLQEDEAYGSRTRTSGRSCAASRSRRCGSRSSPPGSVPTGGGWTTSGPSPVRSGCCPAPRLGALHPGPDAGAGRGDAGDLRGRAAGRLHRLHDRSRPSPSCSTTTSRPSAPARRSPFRGTSRREIGPREPGGAGHPAPPAGLRRVPLHHPGGLRRAGVQRLLVHGLGVRSLALADGCGSAPPGGLRRRGHGADQGRRPRGGPHRHPGLEDALGDMDFKVAGTRDGVTSIQMDIKVEGLTFEILQEALERARGPAPHPGHHGQTIAEPRSSSRSTRRGSSPSRSTRRRSGRSSGPRGRRSGPSRRRRGPRSTSTTRGS
jgi:hypothetical protein